MKVFLVPQVTKVTRKENIPQAVLCRAASEVVAGTLGAGEAYLGGGLFKKRVARPGGGKSAGYRVIIAHRPPRTDRVLFTYAFAKNAASALTPQGKEALEKVAGTFFAADDRKVAMLLAAGDLDEVRCDDGEEG